MKRYLIILITLLLFLPIFYFLNNLNFSESFSCEQTASPVPLLDKKIRQSFIAKKDITAISLKPATYTRKIKGILDFKIFNKNKELVFSKVLDTFLMQDNRFFTVKIDKNILQKNNIYYLELGYKKIPITPIGFWNSKEDCYPGSLLVDSEKIIDSDLVIHAKHSRDNFFSNLKEIINRLSQYKILFLKGCPFILITILFILSTLLFLHILVKKIY